jgi:hypothetical protein
VVERARAVHLDAGRLDALAAAFAADPPARPCWDLASHYRGDPASTLAYVITLDAINFGSGWFPLLRKRPGRSGYLSVALALTERFAQAGPWSARELQALDAAALARVTGQRDAPPEIDELMGLYARALNDLGLLLEAEYGGRFEALLESAGGLAERLVRALARMPLFRDVSDYLGLTVPFYKRAQIAAADLALAFEGRGPGRFRDLGRLTAFADNLVPHVLRMQGALVYEPRLAARIDAGELLAPGAPEEVEIRAAAVQAVEHIVAGLRQRGAALCAHEVDYALWQRGQDPDMKAHPRHRSRSPFY